MAFETQALSVFHSFRVFRLRVLAVLFLPSAQFRSFSLPVMFQILILRLCSIEIYGSTIQVRSEISQ